MILDKIDSHGDGEMFSDLGYNWKVEPSAFASGLHLRYGKEKSSVT